jgi:hypothetical protein
MQELAAFVRVEGTMKVRDVTVRSRHESRHKMARVLAVLRYFPLAFSRYITFGKERFGC